MMDRDRNKTLLLELQRAEGTGNGRCADCGETDPEWASYKLGIFICLNCSGIHRNLPQISRVKSLRLDFWENDLLEFMKKHGNLCAKAKYEAQVPPYYYIPRSCDCLVLREQWIRAKYEREEFVATRVCQDPRSAGTREGFLWKRGRESRQFQKRRFLLSAREGVMKYYTKESRGPKAIISVENLNAMFQTEKIQHAHGLQITYNTDGQTRNLFVYHESGKEIVDWFNAIRAARYHYLRTTFPNVPEPELIPRITRNYVKEGYMEKTGPKEEEIWDISKQLEMPAETIRLLRKELSEAKEYASRIKSQITKDFSCMKEYVERQERNTLMFITQEQKAAEQKIEETIHQLCVEGNKVTDISAQTSNLPERHRYKGSPSTMNKITLDEKLNVVKSAVEDLKRKLEILLLEKYARQFPPVQPPDLHQETNVCSSSPESAAKNPETMISSQFSQWADDVTFDLTRVYERLAITAQNRKVMVSSYPTRYEPSPNRFCISQVMCSQSFSTGCHYWEVITKDSDGWAVGVAHAMIGKRDKLGRTEHSWCIEWLGPKKQLSAWHRDQETLLHKDKPSKVGVFLELQKKTVSFYSITDKEMLLHTFEINTSNPLYPAFWLYSLERNGSLTISHTNRR